MFYDVHAARPRQHPGSTLSYLLICGDRSIENKVTFHGDTSEGVTTTKAPDGTHAMHTKSHRIRACP